MRWFSSDPAVAQDPNENGFADDEDVAAEALRVERMGGVLGEEEGEVVLRGLRKVYRTNQASRKIIVIPISGRSGWMVYFQSILVTQKFAFSKYFVYISCATP